MSKGQSPPTSSPQNRFGADNEPGPAALDRLRGRLVPFRLYFFESLASTNDTAADLAREGAEAPAVVVAGRQTAGRGQRGRTWFSGREALAATFILPIHPHRRVQQLPILAGLVVREALAGLVGEIGLKVKWPNDVELQGRKAAGLLCERKHGLDLVGVGVNVQHAEGEVPPELRGSLVALGDVVSPPGRWDVLASVAAEMRRRLLERSAGEAWGWAVAEWAVHDSLIGLDVEIESPQGRIVGRCDGIDPQGRLRIVGAEGEAAFVVSGTVRPAR